MPERGTIAHRQYIVCHHISCRPKVRSPEIGQYLQQQLCIAWFYTRDQSIFENGIVMFECAHNVDVQNYFIQSVGAIFTLKAHSRDAAVPFGLGHIARYALSPEGNICAPITHSQCKNNFEHLLILFLYVEIRISLTCWGLLQSYMNASNDA